MRPELAVYPPAACNHDTASGGGDLGANKQRGVVGLICAADRPHGATTRSREAAEGLAAIRGTGI